MKNIISRFFLIQNHNMAERDARPSLTVIGWLEAARLSVADGDWLIQTGGDHLISRHSRRRSLPNTVVLLSHAGTTLGKHLNPEENLFSPKDEGSYVMHVPVY